MKKCLLIVVNEPWFFLSHRLPIACEASYAGYDVHVATKQGKGVDEIKTRGLIHHVIPFTRSSINIIDELKTIIALVRLYVKIKPDIVHHVTIKPVLYGGLVARFTRIPAVINAISGLGFVFIASGYVASIRRALVRHAYRFILKPDNVHVIFQNPDDQKYFLDNNILKNEQSIIIKGSGVNLEMFKPTEEPDGIPIVVLVARMLWDKGVGEFVEAASLLREREVLGQFYLVGDIDEGNPKAISKNKIDEWCGSGVVKWNGYVSDIPKVLANSHIVCLPSYREGLPKSLIEAAAAGKPIVTTDVPGCKEVVHHGINGFLVPAKDPVSLANSLEKLLINHELRIKMGNNSRKIAEKQFSVENVVKDTLKLYSEMTRY